MFSLDKETVLRNTNINENNNNNSNTNIPLAASCPFHVTSNAQTNNSNDAVNITSDDTETPSGSTNTLIKSKEREMGLNVIEENDERLRAIFDEEFHKQEMQSGKRRLSFKVTPFGFMVIKS